MVQCLVGVVATIVSSQQQMQVIHTDLRVLCSVFHHLLQDLKIVFLQSEFLLFETGDKLSNHPSFCIVAKSQVKCLLKLLEPSLFAIGDNLAELLIALLVLPVQIVVEGEEKSDFLVFLAQTGALQTVIDGQNVLPHQTVIFGSLLVKFENVSVDLDRLGDAVETLLGLIEVGVHQSLDEVILRDGLIAAFDCLRYRLQVGPSQTEVDETLIEIH